MVTLLYTYSIYSISTVYLPYPYAAPTRAMQGVTSYKSLVLILIHPTPNKSPQIMHLQAC